MVILGNHSPEGPETGTNDVVVITPFPNAKNTDMTARSLDIPKTEDEPLCTMKEATELVGISAQTLINCRKHGLVF